jgi:hypothetical protein
MDSLSTGIFGELHVSYDDGFFSYTLEHAYPLAPGSGPTVSGTWAAKVPAGEYQCVRGHHKLGGMLDTFETFEVKNVPGHTGILFHWGNTNEDSSGCILLGEQRNGSKAILKSKMAFDRFMSVLEGTDEFTLIIS